MNAEAVTSELDHNADVRGAGAPGVRGGTVVGVDGRHVPTSPIVCECTGRREWFQRSVG